MRVSNREKLLLAILVIAALSYLTYTYILQPQWKNIDALETQKKDNLAQIEFLKDSANQEKNLDTQIQAEYTEIEELSKQYYNTTPQEEMILLFNDLFDMPELKANNMTFPEPEVVTVGNLDFLKTQISIDYEGDYSALMNILDTIWAFPKQMQVSELNMVMGELGMTGTVSVQLINLMMDSGMVDNLYTWYIDELFNKENPFTPYTKTNSTIRYIYTGEGSNLFNFSRYESFTDITGYWLEKEINEFLTSGFIYTNTYKTFGPDTPISRGEFIVLLDNVYQWSSLDTEVDLTKFSDYASLGDLESSYAKAIQKGFLSGFLEGYNDNTLRPADPISYSEVELIMKRIKNDDTFGWVTVGQDITTKKSITSEAWLNPNATMTKAEAVYLLTYFK